MSPSCACCLAHKGEQTPALRLQGGPSRHADAPWAEAPPPQKGAPRPGASRRSSPGLPWSLTLCWSTPGPEAARLHIQTSPNRFSPPPSSTTCIWGLIRSVGAGSAGHLPEEKHAETSLRPPLCSTLGPWTRWTGRAGAAGSLERHRAASQPALHATRATITTHWAASSTLPTLWHLILSSVPYPCSPAQPPRAPAASWPLGLPASLHLPVWGASPAFPHPRAFTQAGSSSQSPSRFPWINSACPFWPPPRQVPSAPGTQNASQDFVRCWLSSKRVGHAS